MHSSGLGPDLSEETKLNFRRRVEHFTWSWFTMTMATGGLANVIFAVPDPVRFTGLYEIGCIFFLFNLVLFLFNIAMISTRFYLYPYTFRNSFAHPTESLFVPSLFITLGTILMNITQYGLWEGGTGQWLETTMVILFWIYAAVAVMVSSGIYLIIWSTQTMTIGTMTPIWIFPAYPLLVIGPHAGVLASKLTDPNRAIQIIVGGFILQGIGFMVSFMVYSSYIYRLMTQKLPQESTRPGMFVSVGPSGFTIAGVITMAAQLPRVVGNDFMGPDMGPFAARVAMVIANWVGLWLWGLAIWFFLVSAGAHLSPTTNGKLSFAMNWYSFIFPNTALTTATFAVAKALNDNRPFQILGCIMAVALVLMWFFVFGSMIKAIITRQVLWPQMQEDREEGGWKSRVRPSLRPKDDIESGSSRSAKTEIREDADL